MNEIAYLPSCVGGLSNLEKLDLFKNPIRKLPQELTQLKNLKLLELRSIKFSPEFQEKWEEALPNVKIMFDPPCDCMK
jgi:Leucine-rich repeat (LRR) protein